MPTSTIPLMRWMSPDDLPRAVGIDKRYLYPWNYREFQKALKSPHAMVAVIEQDKFVVGYIAFVIGVPQPRDDGSVRTDVALIKMAVDPDFARQGLGKYMVDAVERYALNRASNKNGRGELNVTLQVRESNLVAQMFFRSQKFKAIKIQRESFGDEDGYVMVRTCNWSVEKPLALPAPVEV